MLSSKLLLFPRQPGWRNNNMKMIDIYKKPELKWPKQNDRNETNLTTQKVSNVSRHIHLV